MSQELKQEQSIEQTVTETSDTPAEGAAPETAAADPATIPDQDEPEEAES
jgi:hypothetical protein